MTVGEKIKSFRSLKQLTQKALADKSGISEISIRKYEAGERNPKPEQLKKIAAALGIGENIFFDIPLNTLEINTVGDVMTLFFLLENKVGLIPKYSSKEDGKIDPLTLSFHFSNATINELIAMWLQDVSAINRNISIINQQFDSKQMSDEEYDKLYFASKSILELTKQKCMENTELLEKKK